MTPEDAAPGPAGPDPAGSRRLGATFARGGLGYDRLRPGYPAAAVDWLAAGVPAAGRVADVGCGTGKLTVALADRGFEVLAVDPSADMLDQLRRHLPHVRTQVGVGERTGLPASSVDLVTFAQSWHWVEPVAGTAEVARILTPGGTAAMIWNLVDVRVGWVAELADTWHTLGHQESLDPERRPELGASFGAVESARFAWADAMTLADLAALVTTRSYYLAASTSEQEDVRHRVAEVLARHFPSGATVELPYRTYVYRAQRVD